MFVLRPSASDRRSLRRPRLGRATAAATPARLAAPPVRDGRRGAVASDRPGGAVLIIVVSLMAALAFLGFFFYEWTEIEGATSAGFADQAESSEIDPGPIFEHGLEQFIAGTRDGYEDSSLHGSKYSLLAQVIGRLDGQLRPRDGFNVHAGQGIHIQPRYLKDTDLDGTLTPEEVDTPGLLDAGAFFDRQANALQQLRGIASNGVPEMIEYVFVDPNTGEAVTLEISDDTSDGGSPPAVALPVTLAERDTLILNFSRTANFSFLPAGGSRLQVSAFNPSPIAGELRRLRLANGTDLAPTTFGTNLGVTPRTATGGLPDFTPGAGYTYPDINSMFLSHDGYVEDFGDNAQRFRVIIPSFFRPQLFPMRRDIDGFDGNGGEGNQLTAGEALTDVGPAGFEKIFLDGATDGTLDLDDPAAGAVRPTIQDTSRMVLQPHAAHRNADGTRRYLLVPTGASTDPLGNTSDYGTGVPTPTAGIEAPTRSGDTSRVIGPYPFRGDDVDGDGVFREMGIFSGRFLAQEGQEEYELDVDADGDGIRDALYMDLDHPIITLPDGRQVVPMFAPKIVDLDGLLNLNAHGNMDGLVAGRAIREHYVVSESANEAVFRGRLNLLYERLGHLYDRDWSNGQSGSDIVSLQFGNYLGRTESISWSSAGTTPFEVNPTYALGASPQELNLDPRTQNDPATYTLGRYPFGRDMLRQFAWNDPAVLGPGANPTTTDPDTVPIANVNEAELAIANMEVASLLGGRVSADGQTRIPGRYGEVGREENVSSASSTTTQLAGSATISRLSPTFGPAAFVPRPGRSHQSVTPFPTGPAQHTLDVHGGIPSNAILRNSRMVGSDDDVDGTTRFDVNRRRNAGQAYLSPFLAGLIIPPDVHPYPGRPMLSPVVKDATHVDGTPFEAANGTVYATETEEDTADTNHFAFEQDDRAREALNDTNDLRGMPLDLWNTVDYTLSRDTVDPNNTTATLPAEMKWPVYQSRMLTASDPTATPPGGSVGQPFGRTYFLHPFVHFRGGGDTDLPGVRSAQNAQPGVAAANTYGDPSPDPIDGDMAAGDVNTVLEAPYGVNPLWLAQGGRLAQVVRAVDKDDAIAFSHSMFSLPIPDVNEADEFVLDPDYRDTRVDAAFEPHELEGLHLSQNDFAATGDRSRIRDLAPLSLEASRRAAENRRRFTTDSWDRLEHALTNPGTRLVQFEDDGSVAERVDLNNDGDALDSDELQARVDQDGDGDLEELVTFRQPTRYWETNFWRGSRDLDFLSDDQNTAVDTDDVFTSYFAAPLRTAAGSQMAIGGRAFTPRRLVNFPYSNRALSSQPAGSRPLPIRAFPPEFGTFSNAGTFASINSSRDVIDTGDDIDAAAAFGAEDPFRPELRRLVGKAVNFPVVDGLGITGDQVLTNAAAEANGLRRLLLGRRLELNGILADGIGLDGTPLPAFEDTIDPVSGSSEPNYRELIPHVSIDPSALTDTDTSNDPVSPTDPFERRMLHINVPLVPDGTAAGTTQPPRLLPFENTTANNAATPLDGVPYPLLDIAPDPTLAAGTADGRIPSTVQTEIADQRAAQEWWARYDRQRLARDIYVLLYTTGGTDRWDPVNSRWLHTLGTPELTDDQWVEFSLGGDWDDDFEYRDTTGAIQTASATDVPDRSRPNDPAVDVKSYLQLHIQEMAQFAVNVVDQMDADSAITRFEYDQDLSDGWQWARTDADFLPGSTMAGYANDDSADRYDQVRTENNSRVVNGVEDQSLLLTEGLAMFTERVTAGNDSTTTNWDDERQRQILHLELRNVSPFPVDLYDGNWRLLRVDSRTGNPIANDVTAAVRFRHLTTNGGANEITDVIRINPGSNFTIACSSETSPTSTNPRDGYDSPGAFNLNAGGTVKFALANSDLYVDVGSGYLPVIPLGRATVADGAAIEPLANLDLTANFANGTGGQPKALNALTGNRVNGIHGNYFAATRLDLRDDKTGTDYSLDTPFENSPLLDFASTAEEDSPSQGGQPDAFALVLQRRRVLNQFDVFDTPLPEWNDPSDPNVNRLRETLTSGGNSDWVEVDRLVIEPVRFDISDGDGFVANNRHRAAFDEKVVPGALSIPTSPAADYIATTILSRQPTVPFAHSVSSIAEARLGGNALTAANVSHSIYAAAVDLSDPVELSIQNQANRNVAATADHFPWQPQFNRRVTSVSELLSTPLYGYIDLEQSVSQILEPTVLDNNLDNDFSAPNYGRPLIPTRPDTPLGEAFGGPTKNLVWRQDPSSNVTESRDRSTPDRTAAARFQNPAGDVTLGFNGVPRLADPIYQNSWARLLDVIALPDRTDAPLTDAVDLEDSYTATGDGRFPGAGNLRGGRDIRDVRTRTGGKLNLNNVRDQAVLLGILDDNYGHFDVFDLDNSGNEPADDQFDVDAANPTLTRNWWDEFLLSRDGFDDFTGLPIPGSFRSQPFRTAGGVSDADDPASQTGVGIGRMSRRDGMPHISADYDGDGTTVNDADLLTDGIPYDLNGLRGAFFTEVDRLETTPPATLESGFANFPVNTPRLGLFESRSRDDVYGVDQGGTEFAYTVADSDDADLIGPWNRNRLLQKVLNNATDRSHVYGVWVAVRFHEADHFVNAAGVANENLVRIGAVAEDLPVYRMFCVVDMSRVEQAYDDPTPNDSVPGTFNYRKFILHSRRLD